MLTIDSKHQNRHIHLKGFTKLNRLKTPKFLLSSVLVCVLLATGITACSQSQTQQTSKTTLAATPQCSSAHACVPNGFQSQFASVNGLRLHYVIGGHGTPLVLLHGWPETWYAWRLIMPTLAQHYTVIVPDLPGLGDSAKPTAYDTQTVADNIYQLIQQHLGYQQIDLVGHDIGGFVAYAYAARHSAAVHRLVILDIIPPSETLLQFTTLTAHGNFWHFSFHNVPDLPEELVAGKERVYLTWFYQHFAYSPQAFTQAFTQQTIDEYVRCYSAPGGMRAGFEYYRAIFTDIAQTKEDSKTKLSMPVLVVTSQVQGSGFYLSQWHQYANNVTVQVLPNVGHWMPEERPTELNQMLLSFLPVA